MEHRITMLWPDGLRKALTFSYDDGVMQDLKLISLFKLYGLKGTFNLNSASFGQIDEIMFEGKPFDHSHVPEEDIASSYNGFEVAIHTSHHYDLTQLGSANAVEEIISDRMSLESIVGYPVRGMAYPYGTNDERVQEIVKSCGVVFSRGTRVTGKFDMPQNPLDWTCSCHHTNLEPLINPFLSDIGKLKLLSVWGHSYEFDMRNSWDTIESQLERLGGNDDVWYASNIEVFDYISAYKSLRYTVNGNIIENPNAADVFVDVDGETLCLQSGARTKI